MDCSIDMIGPGIILGLGCVGSSIGCGIACMASHGAMSRTKEGHGKFIGMSAMPSSQSIYGFILMILMRDAIKAGTLSGCAAIGLALFGGLALMYSSIYQGKCAATAIQATAKWPENFGKSAASLGILETFSIFVTVFLILLF